MDELVQDGVGEDAICDRLVHNAHVVTLRGGPMRKKKAVVPEVTATKN